MTSPSQWQNQCDGCMRGLPVDEHGMHRGPVLRRYIADDTRLPWAIRMPWLRNWNSDVQLCTRDRYQPTPSAESGDEQS